MPLQATAGAATYDAFGGGVTAANYIEDVFQTWLYTGNDLTQTITNGVDLAGKGGLVWLKNRTTGTTDHILTATPGKALRSNTTGAEQTTTRIDAFNSNGFFINNSSTDVNQSSNNYASWTFRKQPKFFDVVTWTGDGGTSGRTISHNLGSAPGCIIVKNTSSAEDWYVYHRSLGNTGTKQYFCILNSTAAQDTGGFGMEKASNWTATQFALASGTSALNTNGATYVAYLFAHDAGGFGASGTDNVISCGSLTTDGSGNASLMNLGWEPQWILFKRSNGIGNWAIIDNMRGMPVATAGTASLNPNLSNAEDPVGYATTISATGNQFYPTTLASSSTYIYIAIRRGPMRTPTSGTSVFTPTTFSTASGSNQIISSPEAIDMGLLVHAPVNGVHYVATRLIGNNATLQTQTATAESTTSTDVPTPTSQNAFTNSMFFRIEGSNQTYWNATGTGTNCFYGLKRAPGFFDVVCYTGNGVNGTTQAHNLSVTPELVFIKSRSVGGSQYPWVASVQSAGIGFLNTTDPISGPPLTANATTFTLGNANNNNGSGTTYVAYLFATVAGVSKVFSYTGNGSSQTINCGFTAGARFVLIKRADSTGDWYVWDSARGIVASNDPHLSLNTTAAEVTTDDSVDTDNTGFVVNQVAATNVNVSSATYIGLAVA